MTGPSRLEPEQQAYLSKQFQLSDRPLPDATGAVRPDSLLDPDSCAAYLDGLSAALRSPSRPVTASQFAKRYAFLSAAPALYAMSVFNKSLDLGGAALVLESTDIPGKTWSNRLHAAALPVAEPQSGQRPAWRRAAAERLFAGHLAPLWRALSKIAPIPLPILWENTAVRIYSLYEKRIAADARTAEEKRRAQDDFEFLLQAPGSVFGQSQNPLRQFYGSVPPAVRLRKTCCLFYQVPSDEGYCSACPKLARGAGPG